MKNIIAQTNNKNNIIAQTNNKNNITAQFIKNE